MQIFCNFTDQRGQKHSIDIIINIRLGTSHALTCIKLSCNYEITPQKSWNIVLNFNFKSYRNIPEVWWVRRTLIYRLKVGVGHNLCQERIKGVLHPWALFLKTLCIFSKNKATSDKVSYGSGQKCSKELKNHSFTSVETIVVKLQWKMCENQYFPCFEP